MGTYACVSHVAGGVAYVTSLQDSAPIQAEDENG